MKAIILAAGRGIRLRPLTHRTPKCLLEINGTTILENCLQNLEAVGVSKTVIVVGHLKELIIDKIGPSYKGMPIEYIVAKDYETTNNIVSLWCARHEFTEDFFLIESDVFFGPDLLPKLAKKKTNTAVVDHYQPGMNGTAYIYGQLQMNYCGDLKDAYKTVNIYLFKEDSLDAISQCLDDYVKAGFTNYYYESIFNPLGVGDEIKGYLYKNWAEVDDIEDLKKAQYKFSSIEEKYNTVSNLHGYFWPYEVTDYCHLYNMYFPPKQMMDYFHTYLDKLVGTYPSGHKELVYYLSEWLNISPEHLAIGNGASELIRVIGGKACVSTPSFNEWESGDCVRVPLDEETWEFNPQAFLDALEGPQSDFGVIVTPNNPTSIAVPSEAILHVLNNTKKKVIIDESFGDFCDTSYLPLLDKYPNLLILKSLGKAFGICGLRLGFVAGDVEEIRKKLPIWNINNFAETFLRQISRYEKQFKESIRRTKEDRDKLYADLCNLGLKCWKPDGNFVFCKTGDVALELFKRGFFVKHCGGKTMKNGNQYIRIGCRTQKENDLFIRALSEVVPSPSLL